jgi:hypothetical protein
MICIQAVPSCGLNKGTKYADSLSLFSSVPPQNSVIEYLIRSLVFGGCETWSLRLREEKRLTAIENRVLKRIFGHKGDGFIGGWRKLHDEVLHNLYSSQVKLEQLSQGGRDGQSTKHEREEGEFMKYFGRKP